MAEKKYYMDCMNSECEFWHELFDSAESCPLCGSKLEPAQIEDWNEE